jgi:beta-xylosidase
MNRTTLFLALFPLVVLTTSGNCRGNSPGDSQAAVYDNSVGIVPDCADPYVLEHDGKYYLYGTGGGKGIRVYVSDDLANWSAAAGASDGFALDSLDVWGSYGFWAPEVYRIDDKFRIYFTVQERIATAESDSPLGPFVQKEEEFEPFHLDVPEIDTHLFIDDDGKKYLYFVRFTGGNEIWVAELNDDLRSINEQTLTRCFGASQAWENSQREPYAHARVNEGPFILKHKGTYYLTYSANHTASPDYGVGYATSNSPMGPWVKYEGNPILTGNGVNINGPGHHSFTHSPSGQLYIVYHTHFDMTRMGRRKLAIDPAGFEPSPSGGLDILRIHGPTSTPQEVK